MTKQQILIEAMRLEPSERDEIAEALWQGVAPDEFTGAQLVEIRRRVEDLDAGRVNAIPGEQVMQELRERFRRSAQ